MRPLRLGCALVLFSCWASVGLAQNVISLIPQGAVPLKPDYSAVFRSQAEVQAGKKFSGFAWFSVLDSLITPFDWEVVLENVISNGGLTIQANFSDWTGEVHNAIPAQSQPIHYEARVEAPALPPIGVVTPPGTDEVLEELLNPNSFADGPWISLVSVDAYPWWHTTEASQHKLVRILVVPKFVQYKPDAANGGRLRIALDLYNFKKKRWFQKNAFLYPNYYQMSVMDLVDTVLDYDNADDREFIANSEPGEPGDLYVKWRIRLTNLNALVEYDGTEGIVEVWSQQLP